MLPLLEASYCWLLSVGLLDLYIDQGGLWPSYFYGNPFSVTVVGRWVLHRCAVDLWLMDLVVLELVG